MVDVITEINRFPPFRLFPVTEINRPPYKRGWVPVTVPVIGGVLP